jgi:hypothetical protein
MDSAVSDTREFHVPPEDGRIARALADLDASIDAWCSALGAAHESLRQLSAEAARERSGAKPPARESHPTVSSTPEPKAPAVAGEEAARVADQVNEPVAQREPPTQTIAAPPSDTGKPVLTRIAARLRGRNESVEPPTPVTAAVPPTLEPSTLPAEPSDAADTAGGDSSDEALLARLDPETAKAIRIKRRLSGNAKSVRALLAEMEKN